MKKQRYASVWDAIEPSRAKAANMKARAGLMIAIVGLLAVTSADSLNAGWNAAQRARERGRVHARSHI